LLSRAFAQTTLTQIRDTVYNVNGTPFNGTVVITWNGYVNSGSSTPLSTSARIYNGALSVLLVPTTTASSGAYYQAAYNSNDGTVTWNETWQVPPSNTPLTLAQVRQSSTQGSGGTGGSGTGSTGSTGSGGSQYATLPISISEVTGLSSNLNTINSALTLLTTQVNGLQSTINSTGSLSGLQNTVNGLSSTVSSNSSALTTLQSTVNSLSSTVNGLSTSVSQNSSALTTLQSNVGAMNSTVTANSNSISTLQSTVAALNSTLTSLQNTVSSLSAGSTAAFSDAETPAGSINGTNGTFTLAKTPAAPTSVALYKNGILQSYGVDFTVSGQTVTFAAQSLPQSGDLMQAFYRTTGTGSAAAFVDGEVPTGAVNGTNTTFTLANAPNPSASLKLYKNGVLLAQGVDYSLSGATITFVSTKAAPQSGDSLLASYRH
jgi:prefoldin subunit 5